MELPEPRDADDARVLKLVSKHGVFIQCVMGDETGPGFGYSMGLTHNFGHPEVFISGLTYELRVSMINEICRRLKEGQPHLFHGQRVPELLEGHDCIAAHVEPDKGRDYVYYAQWLHGTPDVPSMQIIWPSTSGIWPWEPSAPQDFIDQQTVLPDIQNLKDL